MAGMATIAVNCAYCGNSVDKDVREFNRSTKNGRPLYCGRRCAASARNAPIKAQEIVRTCPCGREFVTTTKAKAAEHCSRSCASHYSMSDERREAQRVGGLEKAENLLSTADALKLRENWKYAALREVLGERPHEFEYELGGYVFDLALLDVRVLVEFDGPYHSYSEQLEVDARKDEVARANGFLVVRRTVQPSVVLNPNMINGL
jgi:very-short-patch-repair endonuclease